MYPIIEVPDEAADSTEQLGSKPKFWFVDSKGRRLLFKQGRSGTGENWAEKVSAGVCALLQIPHASYDLAVWRGVQGVVSANFVPAGSRLVFGNELLAHVVKGYDGETRYYRQSGHTLTRVFAVLRNPEVQAPASWHQTSQINTASDVFVGYLMLDALVGNTDRHHENWGLVLGPAGERQELRLAPTFDHASSLGRNEPDERRQARLVSMDPSFSVLGYAQRGRSAFYKTPTDKRPLSTLDAFREASRLRPQAARGWIDRLRTIEDAVIRSLIDEVSLEFMSSPAREFAYQFLLVNKTRLTQQTGDV